MASFFGNVIDYIFGETDTLDSKNIIIDNVKRNNYSSIAAKASEGILQFPVIMSNTIDFDTAILVSKACERAYAGFAKVVFSMNADMSDTGSQNISDYLKAFHQNGGLSTTDSDPATLRNAIESFEFEDKETKTFFTCEFFIPKNAIMSNKLVESLKPYVEDFCLTKLNDLYQPRSVKSASYTINTEGMQEVQKPTKYSRKLIATEAGGVDPSAFSSGEVKKANEMQPTFIKLHVTRAQRVGGTINKIEYSVTIGIKATLHVVPSTEYITNIVDACEYKGTLFRFIRWSSGEIEFVRDFVLRMDLFSRETKNKVNSTSHWWDALRNRAREAKISRVNSNRLLPNATFVLNRAEVDYIKANYGYDLLSDKLANQIMREYFLLGIIIVDPSNELCHIKYDGQSKYQVLTFKAMERENGNVERQFKEMLRASKRM